MEQKELNKLKDRFRKYIDVRPRPVMIRLIVDLDLAYKRIKELEDEKRTD